MTTVFVIAAVLLGADSGKPAPSLKLKQPVIAQQADPAAVVFGVMPTSQLSKSVGGGLIKPVGYEPTKAAMPPVVRVSAHARKGNVSLLQDISPSDSVPVPETTTPMMPTTPMPKTPSPMVPSHLSGEVGLSTVYVADADFTIDSCGCGNSCDSGCESCGCHKAHGCNLGRHHGGCNACGCGGHGHGGLYAKHCLPTPWHAPGNMVPHIPYVAYPKTYYYFRPYNMLHIPDQQAQAASWVDNPALPYSNGVFEKVYAELEPVLNAPGEEIEAILIP